MNRWSMRAIGTLGRVGRERVRDAAPYDNGTSSSGGFDLGLASYWGSIGHRAVVGWACVAYGTLMVPASVVDRNIR